MVEIMALLMFVGTEQKLTEDVEKLIRNGSGH